jgi:hypothetical protein
VHHGHATHEDFTIVRVSPLPAFAPLNFGTIREVVQEFLEDHRRIPVRDIQPTHLGQALVRLVHAYDRDLLVNNSPYRYTDVDFHFERHNQGSNWRALNFNRECWLMLLGFPLDYWNFESIQNAVVVFFGKVLLWENDKNNLARLLVKARVTDLQDVPHFIVVTETEGFHGQSWIVQCEIIEEQHLDMLLAEEDPIPPPPDNGHPPVYDFFGLGQMGQVPPSPQSDNQSQDNGDDLEVHGQQGPDAAPAAAEEDEQPILLDLNLLPMEEVEDLDPVEDQDLEAADLNQNPNGPESMDMQSYNNELDVSVGSKDQDVTAEQEKDPELVLALRAAPPNFLHLEILSEELLDEASAPKGVLPVSSVTGLQTRAANGWEGVQLNLNLLNL